MTLDAVDRRVKEIVGNACARAYGYAPSADRPGCPGCGGDGCPDCEWTGLPADERSAT